MDKKNKTFQLLAFYLMLAALLSFYPAASFADTTTDVAQVRCMPELNLLIIDTDTLYGDIPLYALNSNAQSIKEKYGIVPLSYFTGYIKTLSGDEGREFYKEMKPAPENLSVIDIDRNMHSVNQVTFECRLKTEDNPYSDKFDLYKITLKGLKKNDCPDCSGENLFSVTIQTPERLILDNVPFNFQNGQSPETDRGLGKITLNPHEAYISFSSHDKNLKNILPLPNSPYNDYYGPYTPKDIYLKTDNNNRMKDSPSSDYQ